MEYIVRDILSIHSFRWHFKLSSDQVRAPEGYMPEPYSLSPSRNALMLQPWLLARAVTRK